MMLHGYLTHKELGVGIGTLINVGFILIGGIAGAVGGRFMNERLQDALMKATALCILFVGVGGTVEHMMTVNGAHLVSGGTAMMLVSLAGGAAIGELLNLELRIEQLGEWLKAKTGSENDNSFVNAFVTCSLTVSIGAMAIVGAIQDGVAGDWSTLALKGAIDALIVCVMTASMGRGCIFSALPVLVFEGSITLLARAIQPIMTAAALSNLSLVGSILIFCVGVNLIWPNTFKPANMLPAVVVAVVCALV